MVAYGVTSDSELGRRDNVVSDNPRFILLHKNVAMIPIRFIQATSLVSVLCLHRSTGILTKASTAFMSMCVNWSL